MMDDEEVAQELHSLNVSDAQQHQKLSRSQPEMKQQQHDRHQQEIQAQPMQVENPEMQLQQQQHAQQQLQQQQHAQQLLQQQQQPHQQGTMHLGQHHLQQAAQLQYLQLQHQGAQQHQATQQVQHQGAQSRSHENTLRQPQSSHTQRQENQSYKSRGVRGGNKDKRDYYKKKNEEKKEYYREKNNPYNKALANVANYIVQMALATTEQVKLKQTKKWIIEEENQENHD